ncbi:hypothetical protein HYS72_03560 [Candidatus Pacearchaeota archaeon]|nr:hypothetical protein [Candidatus Pacearchaeota archaeon]MBI2056901.1 hypothetical protein [Candidatus Pacearchaeota archaeon]
MAYLKNIEKMFEETRWDKTKKFFRKKTKQFIEYNKYDKNKKLKSCMKYLAYPLVISALTPIKYVLAGIIIAEYGGCENNKIEITSEKESEIIRDSAQNSLESETFDLYRIED